MLDKDLYQSIFEKAMELWFESEIGFRQEHADVPKPFHLTAAQVIMYPDDRPNEVRLNEEVRLIGKMKLKVGIIKELGDPVFIDDVEEIPSLQLFEDEDPNCGHLTFILLGSQWYGTFDFRYNKGRSMELLSAADEFFQTASHALLNNWLRASVDNLFSAAELAAKAYILTTPLPGETDVESHGKIHSRFNLFSQKGNFQTEHRQAFNELSHARKHARYPNGPLTFSN